MTQVMTTKARRAPACAESLFPLWCKRGKCRQGYQAKAAILVQQDQDQQSGRTEVIWSTRQRHHQCLWQSKTNFSQDNLY